MDYPRHPRVDNLPPRLHHAMPAQSLALVTGTYVFSAFYNVIFAERRKVRAAKPYPAARYASSRSGALTR